MLHLAVRILSLYFVSLAGTEGSTTQSATTQNSAVTSTLNSAIDGSSMGHGVDWRLQSDWPIAAGWFIAAGIALILIFAWWHWQPPRSMIASSSAGPLPFARKRSLALWLLRSTVVALLVAMLGRWQIKRFETDLPDLVVLVDASRSMTLPQSDAGSASGRTRWESAVDLLTAEEGRLSKQLAAEYRLRMYRIGSELTSLPSDPEQLRQALNSDGPSEEASRLGDHWQQVLDIQNGRSTAGLVMITDGAVTEGAPLEIAAEKSAAARLPMIIVRTGSTQPAPQAGIAELMADSNAMVGDVVSAMVRVRWEGSDGKAIPLLLRDLATDQILSTSSFAAGQAQGSEMITMTFLANESGTRRLAVEIVPLAGEIALDDNQREITVDIRDSSFRVLLVQGKPSYEFRFLKHLMERATSQDGSRPLIDLITVLQSGDERYADQDRTARRLPPVDATTLEQLDLIILGDCDPAGLGSVLQQRMAELVTQGGASLLVIAGPRFLPQRLAGTPLESLLPLDPATVSPPSQATEQWRWRWTPLGQLTPSLRIAEGENPWDPTPPFYWLARTANLRPGARVLLQTDSGSATSRNAESLPILISQLAGNGQVWVQLTDESFRLHSMDAAGDRYERYWLQLIRSLAKRVPLAAADEAKLTVMGERFSTSSPISFEVRLGSTLAAIAGNDVEIAVTDRSGNRTLFRATSAAGGGGEYRGVMEGLPPGSYRAVLTRPGGTQNPPSDVFTIIEEPLEMQRAAVDTAKLDAVASQTGGQVIAIEDAAQSLASALPEGRAIRIRPLAPVPIWNHWSVALTVMSLLSCEWILRRRWGSL